MSLQDFVYLVDLWQHCVYSLFSTCLEYDFTYNKCFSSDFSRHACMYLYEVYCAICEQVCKHYDKLELCCCII